MCFPECLKQYLYDLFLWVSFAVHVKKVKDASIFLDAAIYFNIFILQIM